MRQLAILILGCCCLASADFAHAAQSEAENYIAIEALAQQEYDSVRGQLHRQKAAFWAGEYYEGDHLGFNLRLVMSTQVFAYILYSDVGFLGGGNGFVRQTPGGIALQFSAEQDFSHRRLLRGELDQTLVPVNWGGRHYFVAQRDFPKLASSINHGMEPDESGGLFLLRMGDEKVVPKSLEGLPDGIRKFVYSAPVVTTVVSFVKLAPEPKESVVAPSDRYRLSFDKGSAQGLVTGIELWICKPSNKFATVVLDRVNTDTASGVYDTVVGNEPLPEKGWVFTTGQYPSPPPCAACSGGQ
ncbi:MAG TPA: hypothetical protein VGK80_13265 [Rhodanobacteraceae bacterium]